MKRHTALFSIVSVIIAISLIFASCGETEPQYSGTDIYGRNFGEIYEIDSEATGVFRVPYEIGDTSVIGKSMIASNCADYVEVKKTESGYMFTYLCKKGILGSVKTISEGVAYAGTESEKDGYQTFSFVTDKSRLQNKIYLECVVTPMNKTVEYSLTLDLTKAKLAG